MLDTRVENKDDNMDMPDECYSCYSKVELERFYFFGPGHNVSWLCPYCMLDFTHGESDVVRSIAAMLNKLEERLKGQNNGLL